MKAAFKRVAENPDADMVKTHHAHEQQREKLKGRSEQVKGAAKALAAISSLGRLPSLSLLPHAGSGEESRAHPYRPKESAEVALVAKKARVQARPP